MSTQDTARIAEKVRRLLALSTSSNPHEAAAAAAKAQDLLHRYNLEMADIKADEKPEHGREFVDVGNSAGWRSVLLGAVARHNGAYVVNHGAGRHAVIGQPHVIEIVRFMYAHLADEIERLAEIEWRRFEGFATSARRWKTSFRFGAINTIEARLKAQRDQHKAESGTSRALIVVNDQALQATVKQLYPRLTRRSISSGGSMGGYAAGQRAGQGIGLSAAALRSGSRQSSGLLR